METQMDATSVRKVLIDVLQEIQAASGLECPLLGGAIKPVDDLPKFDSKIWPVATGILGAKLGISIANDINIFRQDGAAVPLTIDQIVAKVVAIADAQAVALAAQVNAQ